MRVFVTGGTGGVGSAVVAELLASGHSVLALARSDASAEALTGVGAEVLRGGLADLDVLRSGARQADGVISLAFTRDTADAEACAAFAAEPAVHVRDAAVLFRLALESAPAGNTWHAVADEGVAVLDVATVVGRRLGLAVEPISEDTSGLLGSIFTIDQPASSAHTREALGWTPTHPGLLADLENLTP